MQGMHGMHPMGMHGMGMPNMMMQQPMVVQTENGPMLAYVVPSPMAAGPGCQQMVQRACLSGQLLECQLPKARSCRRRRLQQTSCQQGPPTRCTKLRDRPWRSQRERGRDKRRSARRRRDNA